MPPIAPPKDLATVCACKHVGLAAVHMHYGFIFPKARQYRWVGKVIVAPYTELTRAADSPGKQTTTIGDATNKTRSTDNLSDGSPDGCCPQLRHLLAGTAKPSSSPMARRRCRVSRRRASSPATRLLTMYPASQWLASAAAKHSSVVKDRAVFVVSDLSCDLSCDLSALIKLSPLRAPSPLEGSPLAAWYSSVVPAPLYGSMVRDTVLLEDSGLAFPVICCCCCCFCC